MDIGDAAAWTGDGVAVIALVVTLMTSRQSRAAKKLAARSEARADSIASSSEQMAEALSVIAGLSKPKLTGPELPSVSVGVIRPPEPPAHKQPAEVSAPIAPTQTVPRFSLEFGHAQDTYVLRNVSVVEATNVTVFFMRDGFVVGAVQTAATLAPFEGFPFEHPGRALRLGIKQVTITSDQTEQVEVPLPQSG